MEVQNNDRIKTAVLTADEIREGNENIVRYMQLESYVGGKGLGEGQTFYKGCVPNQPAVHINTLQYHTSLDWLMPVLQKIRDERRLRDFEETIKYLFDLVTPMRSALRFNSPADLFWTISRYIHFKHRKQDENAKA